MFNPKYLGKLNTVYYSIGSKPLADWDVKCKESERSIIQDEDLRSNVLQLTSKNVATSYITTPANPRGSLKMRLPFISLLLKNIGRFFSFEITVLDSANFRRRIRLSNYAKTTRVTTMMCSMPLCLHPGWNHVNIDLAQFTKRTFNTDYVETVRVQVHANCRLRKVYFANRVYGDDELPTAYQLYPTKPAPKKPAPEPAAVDRAPSAVAASCKSDTGDSSVEGYHRYSEDWYEGYPSGSGSFGVSSGSGSSGGGGESDNGRNTRVGGSWPGHGLHRASRHAESGEDGLSMMAMENWRSRSFGLEEGISYEEIGVPSSLRLTDNKSANWRSGERQASANRRSSEQPSTANRRSVERPPLAIRRSFEQPPKAVRRSGERQSAATWRSGDRPSVTSAWDSSTLGSQQSSVDSNIGQTLSMDTYIGKRPSVVVGP